MTPGTPAELAFAVIMTVAGAVASWALWRCWTGRTRRWVRRPAEELLVLSWGPVGALLLSGTGLFLLLGSPVGVLVGAPLVLAGVLLVVPAAGYHLFRFRWWGPRWFRELTPQQRAPDVSDAHTALGLAMATRPGFRSAALAAEQTAGFGERLSRWPASFIYDPGTSQRPHALAVPGGIGGTLALHRGGLVFAGSQWEDRLRLEPTVLAVPLADLRAAAAVPSARRAGGRFRAGRLLLDTVAGELVFEVKDAGRVAARITEAAARGGTVRW